MRASVFLAAAVLLGVTAPAFAQDRTLPTGVLDALRAQQEVEVAPVFQGRSVDVERTVPVVRARRVHHSG